MAITTSNSINVNAWKPQPSVAHGLAERAGLLQMGDMFIPQHTHGPPGIYNANG